MAEILSRSLVGKSIVGIDGTTFGTLYNITMDHESGCLHELIVEPQHPSSGTTIRTDEDDRLRIPISQVKTVSDQIVIQYDD